MKLSNHFSFYRNSIYKTINKYLLAFALLFSFVQSKADVDPCFTIDTLRGCAPFTINVTDCSGVDPSLIFYDYGFGATTASTFTYTTPGVYSVTQIINSGAGGVVLTLEDVIHVYEPLDPEFEIFTCAGNSILIHFTDDYYELYHVDFGDGTETTVPAGTVLTHSYPSSSSFTVTVQGDFVGGAGTCGSSSQDVTTIAALVAAELNWVELPDAASTQLNIGMSPGVVYYLQERENALPYSTLFRLDNSVSTYLLPGRDTEANRYTYRIVAVDSCNGTELLSNEIISDRVFLSPLDVSIQVNWDPYPFPDFVSYDIYRDGALLSSISDVSTTVYIDADVSCTENYCYQVKVMLSAPSDYSESTQKCATSVSTTPPNTVSSLHSTVLDNSTIQLIYTLPSTGFSAVNLPTDVSNAAGFVETELVPTTSPFSYGLVYDQAHCFAMKLTDVCGLTSSSSLLTCPVYLSVSADLTSYTLNWSTYQGSIGATSLSYTIENLDESGSVIRTAGTVDFSTLSLVELSDDVSLPIIRYRVRVSSSEDPDFVSFSNVVEVVKDPIFEIPNAFTPNGDGLNDFFEAKVYFVDEPELTILNSWGNIIFKSNDLSIMWDGKIAGENASSGNYAYFFSGKDSKGNKVSKKGYVVLLR